ncbi:MAG: type II toxin-antitoxin system VapC family toxin [Euryarchaeota archaeon]|nr:type II toxin-antitoxin system VapC family toxin [Euryarchaeota archaeon]
MYVLDTDICVDLYRGHEASIDSVSVLEAEGPLTITAITVQELAEGAYRARDIRIATSRLRRLLAAFHVLDYDGAASWIAGRLGAELRKKGRPIGDLDTMIAACTIAHNGVLVTRNLRHFKRIRGLDVQSL